MGKHTDDSFKKEQNRVHDRQREEDEIAAHHARRGEAQYAGKRTNAAGAARDKQQDAIESRKGRGKKSDAMWDLLVLEQLQAEYEAADARVQDILGRYLTDEEKAFLETIPEEDKAAEQLRIMQEKLARGEITQAQFDEFKAAWDERNEIGQERDAAKKRYNETKDADRSLEGVSSEGKIAVAIDEKAPEELVEAAHDQTMDAFDALMKPFSSELTKNDGTYGVGVEPSAVAGSSCTDTYNKAACGDGEASQKLALDHKLTISNG